MRPMKGSTMDCSTRPDISEVFFFGQKEIASRPGMKNLGSFNIILDSSAVGSHGTVSSATYFKPPVAFLPGLREKRVRKKKNRRSIFEKLVYTTPQFFDRFTSQKISVAFYELNYLGCHPGAFEFDRVHGFFLKPKKSGYIYFFKIFIYFGNRSDMFEYLIFLSQFFYGLSYAF